MPSTAIRWIPTTASLKISIRLRAISEPYIETPVTLPPGQRKTCDKAGAQRIGGGCHDDGNGGSLPFRRERRWCADDDDGVGSKARKLCRKLVVGLGLTEHEPVFDCKVLTFDVAKVAKPAEQCPLKVGVGGRGEKTQARRPQSLLCVRNGRPSRRCAGNRFDEIAAPHSSPQPRTQAISGFQLKPIKTGNRDQRNRAVAQFCAAESLSPA